VRAGGGLAVQSVPAALASSAPGAGERASRPGAAEVPVFSYDAVLREGEQEARLSSGTLRAAD
jgi:hypothetical protein